MQLTEEQKRMLEEQKAQCVFCRIVNGQIDSNIVYEDETIIAFLDIFPASIGHVIVIPKEHYQLMAYMPKDVLTHLFRESKKISNAMLIGLEAKGTSMFVASGGSAGQVLPHFGLHIIPRSPGDSIINLQYNDLEKNEALISKLREMTGMKKVQKVEKITVQDKDTEDELFDELEKKDNMEDEIDLDSILDLL